MTVAVVICAYTERRWGALRRAVESVRGQTRPADEVVVVIDHNEELLSAARAGFGDGDAVVVENQQPPGLSGARNTGVRTATSDVVAFLDDDASAEPDWLAVTMAAYEDPAVVGTGGLALPRWSAAAPRWLPEEFYWTVGCSHRGLPSRPAPVRNPIGTNMSFRKEVFDAIGGFRSELGRIGRTPLGCEETELAIRAQQHDGSSVVLFLPGARVDHLVAPERATARYFYSRCWAEGVSKAVVSATVGARDGLASERTYVTRTLPAGVLRGIADAARGDAGGLLRAGSIVLGLAITAAGYVRGRAGAGAGAR